MSAEAHHGIDQLTVEARAQAVARAFDPFLVNTVVGFIGPEYLADGRQIIRADLEGTVLVSCTRQSDSPSARGRLGHDGSLVLLIGAGEQAGRTYHLIEDWRAAGTALRLRPTTLASTIELYDRRDNALRANLLAP